MGDDALDTVKRVEVLICDATEAGLSVDIELLP